MGLSQKSGMRKPVDHREHEVDRTEQLAVNSLRSREKHYSVYHSVSSVESFPVATPSSEGAYTIAERIY